MSSQNVTLSSALRSSRLSRRAFCGLLTAGVLAHADPSHAAATGDGTLLILAETVYPISGPPIRNGYVSVRGGRIVAIGAGSGPSSAATVLRAKAVMPGLIDAHSHYGVLYETEETVDAITPDLRICDGFDATDSSLRTALRAGVTTFCLMPGNGNVFAGQSGLYHLGAEATIERANAGQKLSLTAATLQRNPTSRSGVLVLLRQAFDSAKRGRAVSSVTQTNLLTDFPTSMDERVRALLPLLRGESPVFIHAPTADDVENALRLCADYRLKGVLLHATEGAEVGAEIRSSGMPVVLGPLRYSDTDRMLSNAGKLAKAGVKLAFCSDAPLSAPGCLRLSAALAVKYGLSPAEALRSLTLSPAEILGIADRTGSLGVGKQADLLLLGGDPLDLTSRVEAVVSAGKIVYKAGSR